MDIVSTLGWWQLAGADTLVEDAPRDWLAAPAAAPPAVPAHPESAPLPATLAAMQSLLATAPLFGGGARLAPEGDPASGLMVLIDMPESADAGAGQLLTGGIGLLFERMLAAIGRDRASIYLATITPARPPGGTLSADAAADHARLALRHAALAQPRALLAMGTAASRAILDADLHETRGRIHTVKQGAAHFAAVTTFHPRFLFRQPARKAGAWRDLRLLAGALAR